MSDDTNIYDKRPDIHHLDTSTEHKPLPSSETICDSAPYLRKKAMSCIKRSTQREVHLELLVTALEGKISEADLRIHALRLQLLALLLDRGA